MLFSDNPLCEHMEPRTLLVINLLKLTKLVASIKLTYQNDSKNLVDLSEIVVQKKSYTIP